PILTFTDLTQARRSGNADTSANYVQALGNELTNCGNPAAYDVLYHVLYFAGPRGQGAAGLTTDHEAGGKYFHGNNAARAINFFNSLSRASDVISWAMTRINIHDNVIVNHLGVGLLDLDGVPRPSSGAWAIGAYQ